MSDLFDKLVPRYKSANIAFPSLKPVTLAQRILESGRGTSALSTEHLNFAGLKSRSEMVGFATPFEHQAHDGLEFYCKFASLAPHTKDGKIKQRKARKSSFGLSARSITQQATLTSIRLWDWYPKRHYDWSKPLLIRSLFRRQ